MYVIYLYSCRRFSAGYPASQKAKESRQYTEVEWTKFCQYEVDHRCVLETEATSKSSKSSLDTLDEFEKSESGLLCGGRVSICALKSTEERFAGEKMSKAGGHE